MYDIYNAYDKNTTLACLGQASVEVRQMRGFAPALSYGGGDDTLRINETRPWILAERAAGGSATAAYASAKWDCVKMHDHGKKSWI